MTIKDDINLTRFNSCEFNVVKEPEWEVTTYIT